MQYFINFTEEEPETLVHIKTEFNEPLYKGTLSIFQEHHLKLRVYGFNLIKRGKRRYYYRTYVRHANKDILQWFELKRAPKSVYDFIDRNLIKSVVADFKFIYILNSFANDNYRKTHQGRR